MTLEVKDDGYVQLFTGHVSRNKTEKVCASCHRPVGSNHERHCRYYLEHVWQQKLPLVDLRPICRDSHRCLTSVSVLVDRHLTVPHKWLLLGQAHLDRRDGSTDECVLRAYLGRHATDFEHDSAYALQLSLYGVAWKTVTYQRAVFRAIIPPDLDLTDFRVPAPGYNPFNLDKTVSCERCANGHPIVPEGHYVPHGDPATLDLVRGKRVEITFGFAEDHW